MDKDLVFDLVELDSNGDEVDYVVDAKSYDTLINKRTRPPKQHKQFSSLRFAAGILHPLLFTSIVPSCYGVFRSFLPIQLSTSPRRPRQ